MKESESYRHRTVRRECSSPESTSMLASEELVRVRRRRKGDQRWSTKRLNHSEDKGK